jgi:hypothetical protein
MKKLVLYLCLGIFSFPVFAQSKLHKIHGLAEINLNNSLHSLKKKPILKNLNCFDTLRYAEAKEQTLSSSPTYYYLDLWRADNEEISMTFLSSFTNSIVGVEILAKRDPNSIPTNVVVQASIYTASQSYEPQTLVGSGTINISDTTNFQNYIINFPTSLNVNGNYCVVVKPITTNGIIDLTVNDANLSNYDELFCRFKSDYYASSSGQWIAIPSFSEFIQPADFEPLVAPIVSYNLGTQISASQQIICQNQNLVLNAQITPNGIYGNRFYNWYSFLSHFNTNIIDSTLNWQTPNSLVSNNSFGIQANVEYNSVNQHIVSLENNFGFQSYCTDLDTLIITINEPNTSAGNDVVICEGESISLNAIGADTYLWNNNIQNGIPFTPINSGVFIVNGQSIYGCSKIDSVLVTVNPLPNVSLTAFNSLCDTAGIVTLTGGSPVGGAYSGTSVTNNAFDAAIGEGTYPITYSYTDNNGCSSTATQSVTVIDCSGSSIGEINESGFILYPNPASKSFTIESTESNIGKLFELHDVTGRIILSGKLESYKTQVTVSDFATGTYYLKVPELEKVFKFVKQ